MGRDPQKPEDHRKHVEKAEDAVNDSVACGSPRECQPGQWGELMPRELPDGHRKKKKYTDRPEVVREESDSYILRDMPEAGNGNSERGQECADKSDTDNSLKHDIDRVAYRIH